MHLLGILEKTKEVLKLTRFSIFGIHIVYRREPWASASADASKWHFLPPENRNTLKAAANTTNIHKKGDKHTGRCEIRDITFALCA